jgi:hypothetical protein
MQNVRETKALPFLALLTPEDRLSITDQEIPESLKAAADTLGVEKISDSIDFSLSLGSVIFDIYHVQTQLPKAPLAQEREKAKRLKLAESLEQDDFEVPEDIKQLLEKTLTDDSVWEKIAISTHYKVGEENRMLQLSSVALDVFQDTKKALMSLFV